MNVLVNGTTLKGKAYAERDTVTGIITCTVIVPKSEMDYAELKALFKGNTEDIIYTKEDESTELFSGFSYKNILDDDESNQYIVKLTSDEHSFQLGRNRQLEADKASLQNTVASKEMEISNLNVTISEKDKLIAEREKIITARDNVIKEKEASILEKKAAITELEQTIEELKQGSTGESGMTLEDIVAAIEEGVNEA